MTEPYLTLRKTIMEELDARGWSFAALEAFSGIKINRLRWLMMGIVPMDMRIAIGLAKTFGTSAELWINLGKAK